MNVKVIFSRKAGEEAIEQAIDLEAAREGYGELFKQALRSVVDQLSNRPELYPATIPRPDIRVVRMPKPFGKSHSVYYKFDGEVVRILCVFPNRRDPGIWQGR